MSEQDKSGRLLSIDALRGADMLCIIGGATAVLAFCRWVGWGNDCWLARQMVHVPWHWSGFCQHDTIFPLFLFLAGVSWPFSLASQRRRGRATGQILRKIGLRVVALFLLGICMENIFAFRFETVRFDSVLFHIGFCWAVAALLYLFVKRGWMRLAIAALLLVGHWALLASVRAPDAAALLASTDPDIARRVASYAAWGTDNFSFTGNLAGWVDRTFMPGWFYEGCFDPDGLLAKMTGVVTAIFGTWAGDLLRRTDRSGNRKTLTLLGAAVLTCAVTVLAAPWCPVNKKIWTSTFVLAAGSYSFFMLAVFYWIIDVRGWRRWAFFFQVIGMNAITIFVGRRFLGFRRISDFFLSGVASLGSASWHDLVLAVGTIAVEWLFLYYLYRQKLFLRV